MVASPKAAPRDLQLEFDKNATATSMETQPQLTTMQMFYGYLADENWLREQAIARGLVIMPVQEPDQSAVEYAQDYQTQVTFGMPRVVDEIADECDINITFAGVWVAKGYQMCFYALPKEMVTKYRTPEAAGRLQKLKSIIGVKGEPSYYTSLDEELPAHLEKVTVLPAEVAAMYMRPYPRTDISLIF